MVTTNKPTSNILQAGCPFCHQTNSVRALEGKVSHSTDLLTPSSPGAFQLCLWPWKASGYLGGGLPRLSSALWCQYPKQYKQLLSEYLQYVVLRAGMWWYTSVDQMSDWLQTDDARINCLLVWQLLWRHNVCWMTALLQRLHRISATTILIRDGPAASRQSRTGMQRRCRWLQVDRTRRWHTICWRHSEIIRTASDIGSSQWLHNDWPLFFHQQLKSKHHLFSSSLTLCVSREIKDSMYNPTKWLTSATIVMLPFKSWGTYNIQNTDY